MFVRFPFRFEKKKIFIIIMTSFGSLLVDKSTGPIKEMEQLAGRLVTLVQDLVSPTPTTTSTRFNAPKIPKISLSKYIERIMRYCPTSKTAWIVSFIYIKRVLEKCGNDFIHNGSVHRLLLTSVVLGSKFCDEDVKQNNFYARVGGLSVEELNDLEMELLNRLEFRLYVEKTEYAAFENSMCPDDVEPTTAGDMVEKMVANNGSVPFPSIVGGEGNTTPLRLDFSSLLVPTSDDSSSSSSSSPLSSSSSSTTPPQDQAFAPASLRQLASFFAF